MAHLSRAVQNGAMWAKFGQVECVAAPRRRTAGLVAVGIDRLVVPDNRRRKIFPKDAPNPARQIPPQKQINVNQH